MRVCITGMGTINPLAADVAGTLARIRAGESAIVALPAHPAYGLSEIAGGICPDDPPIPGIEPHRMKGFDRTSVYSVHSAEQALRQAASGQPLDRQAIPLFWGCSMGGFATLEQGYEDLMIAKKKRLRPTTIPYAMPSTGAFQIANLLDVRGPSTSISGACASSALAIIQAARLVASGEADIVLAGGVESIQTPAARRAWQMTQAVSPVDAHQPGESCRPFSLRRSGFPLAEGAACLVLESEASARRRGVRPLGWIRGAGHTTDAGHISRPERQAQVQAIRQALGRAGLVPADIGYINAHGTATQVGDLSEAQAILDVFGADNPALPVSSTKAHHGHLIGASGALEAIVTLGALQAGWVPGNPHSPDVDPAIKPLNVIGANQPADGIRFALSHSFAFGGVNAVLALEAAP